MRLWVLAAALVLGLATEVRAQEDEVIPAPPVDASGERPDGPRTLDGSIPLDGSSALDASSALGGPSTQDGPSALSDPFGLDVRAHQLDLLLAADARSAEQARTFGAVMGYVIGALGIGATPIFFALDDGSGLFPILSILPLQLGALSLATAILGSVSVSTEERRYASWQRLGEGGRRRDLSEIARHEGFLVADADRAQDARLFSIAQGIAGIGTGLFTGIVGLSATSVELTQITLGALGGVEILIGILQLIGALEAGDIESRPRQYEARTGVRLSFGGMGLRGSF